MSVSSLKERDPKPRRGARSGDSESSSRRADILSAAATAFAEKGFDGAQTTAIVARAEVAFCTLYDSEVDSITAWTWIRRRSPIG